MKSQKSNSKVEGYDIGLDDDIVPANISIIRAKPSKHVQGVSGR